jgi:CheY-like chemotaxis protein
VLDFRCNSKRINVFCQGAPIVDTGDGAMEPETPGPAEVAALGAAHDANQRLAVILGRAELLLRGDLSVAVREQVEQIAAAAREAAAILGEALGAGYGATGDDPAGPTLLAPAARRACTLAGNHPRGRGIASRGIRCEFDVPEDLAAAAPPVAVGEILMNLVLNACAAMPGGGQLRFRARRQWGRAAIDVVDTGPGVPETDRAGLFDAVRGKGSQGGWGLGLPWARQLAERHGGTLVLAAEDGPGAVFRLEFPAAAVPADPPVTSADHPAETAPADSRADADPEGRLNVLVVDDEAPVREMLAEVLAALGHRSTVVHDASEARRQMREKRYAAALLDMSLPGEDGLTLAGALKELDPALIVILMSGWGNERTVAAADASRVDFTATKPLEIEVLRGLMEKVKRRRATSERRGGGTEVNPTGHHEGDSG